MEAFGAERPNLRYNQGQAEHWQKTKRMELGRASCFTTEWPTGWLSWGAKLRMLHSVRFYQNACHITKTSHTKRYAEIWRDMPRYGEICRDLALGGPQVAWSLKAKSLDIHNILRISPTSQMHKALNASKRHAYWMHVKTCSILEFSASQV